MPRTIVKRSPISEAVNRRFFAAIDTLVSLKLVPSLESFCNNFALSAPRYREMRLEYGLTPTPGYVSRYKNVEVEALSSLAGNFPLSANWLLTGRGKMLTGKAKP